MSESPGDSKEKSVVNEAQTKRKDAKSPKLFAPFASSRLAARVFPQLLRQHATEVIARHRLAQHGANGGRAEHAGGHGVEITARDDDGQARTDLDQVLD